jgi:hypothetical protein
LMGLMKRMRVWPLWPPKEMCRWLSHPPRKEKARISTIGETIIIWSTAGSLQLHKML